MQKSENLNNDNILGSYTDIRTYKDNHVELENRCFSRKIGVDTGEYELSKHPKKGTVQISVHYR